MEKKIPNVNYVKPQETQLWKDGHKAGFEHSKGVIEELVKALEESKEELNRCLPFVQNTRQFYAVHGKIIMIDELIQKRRNNEKQG